MDASRAGIAAIAWRGVRRERRETDSTVNQVAASRLATRDGPLFHDLAKAHSSNCAETKTFKHYPFPHSYLLVFSICALKYLACDVRFAPQICWLALLQATRHTTSSLLGAKSPPADFVYCLPDDL